MLGTNKLTSNQVPISWVSGFPAKDTSFLTLDPSPSRLGGATAGKAITLVASLSDISTTPPKAVVGASVQFSLQGNSCFGTTDTNGNASCSLTPSTAGMTPLSANFGGNSSLLTSTATIGFNVTTFIPTVTPKPTGTLTPRPTPTPIPTLIPTHTPVPTHTPTPIPTHTPTPSLTPTPTPRR